MRPRLGDNAVLNELSFVLRSHTSGLIGDLIVDKSCRRCGIAPPQLTREELTRVLPEIEKRIKLFITDAAERKNCLNQLSLYAEAQRKIRQRSSSKNVTLEITSDTDVVRARNAARQICRDMGFALTDQTKIATVVSELTRNVVMYGSGGKLTITSLSGAKPGIEIIVTDEGPGIGNLDEVFDGNYRSRGGMGLGLRGSKQLMDLFDVESTVGTGTRIVARKFLG